ncbi:MAG: NAD-dependent epimerase/dehydratase family protein [Gemmatimonadota bacterium]
MASTLGDQDLIEILEDTNQIWPSLSGATVFVTGVTGFVGTWLVAALARARAEIGVNISLVLNVRSLERFHERFPDLREAPWITLVVGDVREIILPSVAIDFVVHAASTVRHDVYVADPFGTSDLVTRGTQSVLGAAVERGATRALVISSGSIYSRSRARTAPIQENDGLFPDPFCGDRVLAESKRLAESSAATISQRSGMQVVVARGFAMSGPWLPLDSAFAIGNFVLDALKRRPIHVAGDGSPVRSYLYGGDVATWLWTLLLKGDSGHAYNVGSPDQISIGKLAELVGEIGQVPVERSQSMGAAEPDFFVPDVSKSSTLGLRSRVRVDDAVQRMLAWHRSRMLGNAEQQLQTFYL